MYKVCSLLNFAILLLKSITYYEQKDSHIECTITINKKTKIQNYIDTGHKGLEKHHCEICYNKKEIETNLSNAILNSNNNNTNDINNNTSHNNNIKNDNNKITIIIKMMIITK